MATSNEKLTTKQHAAIAALLTARDIKGAAAAAGVAERTLHTWLDQPDFKAALQTAEAELIDTAVRRLADTAGYAIDVLRVVMADKEQPGGVRVRAALGTLEQLARMRELNQLEARIAALEAINNVTQ